MSQKPEDVTIRIVINDDGDWPKLPADDVRVELAKAREERGKLGNAKRLTLILGGLFFLYTAYAMKEGDGEMLRSGFDFVKLALAASVTWTFGRGGTSIS